ncbi:MAG: 3-phosphoshikimate 1-carboxyvinyltransferase [Saprospiraceae bacterium]|nr:3-phosphoshikimate 1-carboxyvinyltransferase [Saprospiraceae bacterium]
MTTCKVSKPNRRIVGEITLDGSKSISNRILIIKALCEQPFAIHNLSTSNDTQTLVKLLAQTDNDTFDCGAAGTTFRFLTAYFSLQEGTQILTGSERMKQRPIGKLVNALRALGCDIEYLGTEGYPPLKINAPKSLATDGLIISADTSSQYITALLLIAPTLPKGLKLTLDGTIVSRPYIEMTLSLMSYFGVQHTWEENTITVEKQAYQPREVTVEADWSAASYYYAMAAFADELDLTLNGLFKDSLQGDSVANEIGFHFGVDTTFTEGGIVLKKTDNPPAEFFEWDFVKCPDIAQTFAVVCAGKNVQGLFTGLETLFIKETDRVAALKNELAKVGVSFVKMPARFTQKSQKQYFMVEGKFHIEQTPRFPTYEDHRMAMAFAPLAMFHEVEIEEPKVVGKSYPQFWEDLQKLGFEVK